jgi:selenium-binding protein 1
VADVGEDPRRPKLVKVIQGDEVMARTGYSWPKTVHSGPDGVYINALGSEEDEGPGGIFVLDRQTFDIKGPWERYRGPQYFACDFTWHPDFDAMVTSEWGTPGMVGCGVDTELLQNGKYGNALHVWDMRGRRHVAKLDLGPCHQMTLKLRPAHHPEKPYGFAAAAVCLEDLSASVWLWYLDGRNGEASWQIRKVIEIPAAPADGASLPPVISGLGAVPPLVTSVNLSLDDRFLYVSCWGTGELRQYDVRDPFNPVLTGSVRLGGIVERTPHPAEPETPRNGGPQAIEISRDARRVYVTNSLYSPWDDQFYPDGVRGWMVKLDAKRDGGLELDPRFFLDTGPVHRPRHVRLHGGDTADPLPVR